MKEVWCKLACNQASFIIYEYRAKPATEMKRSGIEVVHGGVEAGMPNLK